MNKAPNRDEIDLLDLLLKGVNLVRSNFWLILIFFLAGTILGFTYYNLATKTYRSRMVVSSNILTKSYCDKLMSNLNRHRREMDLEAIKTLLKVSNHTAESATLYQVESLSDLEDLKETDRFIITVDVTDQGVLPELQKGLIYYFENNEFVKIRVQQNKKLLEQMLATLEGEIKDMESFKQKIISGEFYQRARGNVMFDPTAVNSKIIEMTEKKITLQNNLQLANSVQIIEGFSQFQRPNSPRLSVSLISGASIGVIFVGVLIALKSIRKLLRMADAVGQQS